MMIPKDFKFKTSPFKHQIEGIEYGLTHDRWLLADEMGCISGDCEAVIKENGKIATRKIKLKYLYEHFQKDKTIQIKSLVNGRFVYMPIKSVVYKGVKETLKITLEDTSIVCTPDHLIYTQNGWIRADKLQANDLVFTNGKQACPDCGTDKDLITYPYSKFLGYCKRCMYSKRNSKYKNVELVRILDKDGYVRLRGTLTHSMPNYERLRHEGGIYEHHQVWFENTGHIVDTTKEVVHHKNGIKTDNRIENLELLSINEHAKLHSDTKSKHLYQFNENLDFVMRGKTKIYLVPRLQKIVKIEPEISQDVYDVEIDSNEIHNYICNNVIVHNCGKSKIAIDIANIKKVKHCLIICCKNGLKWNWKEQVSIHSYEDSYILGLQRGNNIGSNHKRLEDLNRIDELPRFIITNIETLKYRTTTGEKIEKRVKGKWQLVDRYRYLIAEKLQQLCESGQIDMIVVDEFHRCRNQDTEMANQLLKLNAPIQIAITGTPVVNSPLDVFMPLKWLGYEDRSYGYFKRYYCRLGGYNGTEVIGYKHLNELTDKLSGIMLRRLKEDRLDLPDKIFIKDYVEMNSKQEAIYKKVKRDTLKNIDKIRKSNNPLTEFIRLRQATGYTGILSDTIKLSAKFDRMEELVEDAVNNGEKVVIFSNWTQITNPAYKRLSKKYKGVLVTGELKDNLRQVNMDKFQNDESINFLIGTIDAVAEGPTLTAGTVEIFLDEPWNMALKEQAIDRCHRIGQTNKIIVYTLITKDTIDTKIHTLVEHKGEMSDILIDNKIIGDKNALINYLLS